MHGLKVKETGEREGSSEFGKWLSLVGWGPPCVYTGAIVNVGFLLSGWRQELLLRTGVPRLFLMLGRAVGESSSPGTGQLHAHLGATPGGKPEGFLGCM